MRRIDQKPIFWICAIAAAYLLMYATTAFAQSFSVSGGRQSFIVTGSGPAVAQQRIVTETTTRVTPRKIVQKTETKVKTVQSANQEYSVLVFTTAYCEPCQRMKRITVPELRRRGIRVIELSDSVSAAQYGVTAFPVVIVKRNDRIIRRWSGYVNPDSLMSDIGSGTVVASPPVQVQPTYSRPSSVMYGGRAYSGRVCSNPNCQMCNQIQRGLMQYQPMSIRIEQPSEPKDFGQEPASMDVVNRSIAEMNLTSEDVFADLGCGDGRAMIAAVQASGCIAIGVEIDPEKAKLALANIAAAGLEDKCSVIAGDARDFDTQKLDEFEPQGLKVTALYCYLYPELLAELRDKFEGVRVGVTPYHAVDGLPMREVGDLFVFEQ